MSKTYIELTSGFRNRLLYPNTADFVVNPCELNAENHNENANNVSDAYPFYNFWSLPLNIIKRYQCSATQIITVAAGGAVDQLSASDLTDLQSAVAKSCGIIFKDFATGRTAPITNVEFTQPLSTANITVLVPCDEATAEPAWTVTGQFLFSGDISTQFSTNPFNQINSVGRLTTTLEDTGNYKPELLPMNYGLDTCNMHLTTQYIENNGAEGADLQNKLSSCCVGTAGKPIFSNHIFPIQTVTNMYNYKIEIDNCKEITSIYNTYSTTGLILPITGQCCLSRYFDGMVMSNFTSDSKSSNPDGQNCNECSTITISRDAATLPITRCCDIIVDVRPWNIKNWDQLLLSIQTTNLTGQQLGQVTIGSTVSVQGSANSGIIIFIYPGFSGSIGDSLLIRLNQHAPLGGGGVLVIGGEVGTATGNWGAANYVYPSTGEKIDASTAFSKYFTIDAAKNNIIANSVGCITACPVTDSVSFDVSSSFTGSYRCVDWFGKDSCWDQIECEKAQYNPYILNTSSWNCVRIQGGGPTDTNNAYCCSFLEMIPVPINAYKNYSYALPGGLSDRFKVISNYDTENKLASFNAYDCCNALAQRQWQRMIYWMLYARCCRDDTQPPRLIYNPDKLCDNQVLNSIANGTPSNKWPINSRKVACADDGGAINNYSIDVTTDAPTFTNASGIAGRDDIPASGGCGCDATFNISSISANPPTAAEIIANLSISNTGKGYKVGDSLIIDADAFTLVPGGATAPTATGQVLITVRSITPNVFWPDIGLPLEGTNYIWNYRMRKQMPELIATANIGKVETVITYDDTGGATESNCFDNDSKTTIDYASTTPPLFLFGVPYSVELLTGGSGYTRGGYFIYGVDNCDLFEITFAVNCGEVIDVRLSKLALDQTIYEKLSQNTDYRHTGNPVGYCTNKCDIGKQPYYFNMQIPEIIELNEMRGGQYTYNWDGQNEATRMQTQWFGGRGACIRINKGYGFFSNLGHTEQTNYAHQTMNTRYGPANNDKKGCLLFLPSVAEACTNNFGELRNSLNFSTFYQTDKQYSGTWCENDTTYNLKYQINSQMKFMQQYPKLMDKQVGCQYNYAHPPFNSDSTGTTPIIANYSTQDIPIYWSKNLDPTEPNDWEKCRFNSIASNTQTVHGTPSTLIQNGNCNYSKITARPGTLIPPPATLGINTGSTRIQIASANSLGSPCLAQFDITFDTTVPLTSEQAVPAIQTCAYVDPVSGGYVTAAWDSHALTASKTASIILSVPPGGLTGPWTSANILSVIAFKGVISATIVQQLVQGSVMITKNSFPGFPLNIDGLWNISASDMATDGSMVGWDRNDPTQIELPDGLPSKTIPAQCCAYEWEVLPVTTQTTRPINNQLIPKSSTQEQTCWRINLRNLVIPNITLQSGSLASFYPYFYVEFTNVTDVQRQHQMIQSNNPNAKPALFRCAVTDIATPVISKFLKLTGDGMFQTVKFRPNDSLKLKIYLPDGREFMTTQPDTAPPSPVNPLLQLSALFEVEHLQ